MELDKLITRRFTGDLDSSGKSVYDLFNWKKVSVLLKDYNGGNIIADMKDLEFPDFYSQSACDIIASKYFRKKGVNNECGCEYSMRQLVHRMVDFWTLALLDEKVIDEGQRQIVYDELAYMLLNQMLAPNSPQWFNTGLAHSYGIKGRGQGHYYFDEQTGEVRLSDDAYTRTQGSACFIISVEDTLIGEKSLTGQLATETLLFKYGSGVGTNWSSIRGKNESLSGGGKSSGLLSFLKVSDRNAGAIKSGGTTRRAAKMNILDLEHPEILDFVRWKAHEEDKAYALGKMGYSTSFEGEAYDTVSGQNSNNSVRIPDSFMKEIYNSESVWKLKGRIDNTADGDINVKALWDEIAIAAWRCGDPGIQFDSIINAWHTCPAGEDGLFGEKHNRINASNPCSEYMFLDDTACNLASINLVKFYDEQSNSFDIDGYLHTVLMAQLVLEATIHWGQFPTRDIARKSYKFRTTGLGYTNLGTLFMLMAKPYDSEYARNTAAALMSVLTGYSYYTSAMIAEKTAPFEAYEINKEYMLNVIGNHAQAANINNDGGCFDSLSYRPVVINHEVLNGLGFDNISGAVNCVWEKALCHGRKFGYRNAQVSVLAPTGTIAFAMDCATTSSEPFFSHVTFKKLSGGGYIEIINPVLPAALNKLGYTEEESSAIIEYVMRKTDNITDGKIEGAPYLKDEHLRVFDTANKCGTGIRYISPEGHVKMMGALAPHVSGAISKTVNLPNEATADDVKNIYELSWKLGVKAIALYRDGCKASQPLNSTAINKSEKPLTDYSYSELIDYINKNKSVYMPLRIKPQGIRRARVHEAQIDGLKLYITTSFYEDGRLGEIYVSSGRQGSLVKGLLDSISTTLSEMLQYGVPPADIARMYRGQKYEPSGFVTGHPYIKSVDSISDLISKIIDIELGDYTFCQVKPDNYKPAANAEPPKYTAADYLHGEVCPFCKSTKLVKNGSCKVCSECGSTTGCS